MGPGLPLPILRLSTFTTGMTSAAVPVRKHFFGDIDVVLRQWHFTHFVAALQRPAPSRRYV